MYMKINYKVNLKNIMRDRDPKPELWLGICAFACSLLFLGVILWGILS